MRFYYGSQIKIHIALAILVQMHQLVHIMDGTLSQRKELNAFLQHFIFSVSDMAGVIMHMDILQAGQLEMRLMQIPRGIIQVTSLRLIMHIFIQI